MTDLDDQHEDIRKRSRESGGAHASVRDPRVSRAINWVLAGIGTALVAVGTWMATSINELNLNVAKVLVRLDSQRVTDDFQNARISRAEDRLEDLTGDVRTLEGRNLRSGPEVRRDR